MIVEPPKRPITTAGAGYSDTLEFPLLGLSPRHLVISELWPAIAEAPPSFVEFSGALEVIQDDGI